MSVCGILCGADDWNSIRLFAEQEGKDHGRVEHRRCWVSNDISEDSSAASWGAKTIAAIQPTVGQLSEG